MREKLSIPPLENNLFHILNMREGVQTYLLVDTVLFEGFWTFWANFQPLARQSWCALFQHSPYEHLLTDSPLLVEVQPGGAGETLLYWLVEQPEAFNAGCMLFSGAGLLSEALQFWQRRMNCRVPEPYFNEDEPLTHFACYTPAVMTLFWSTLSTHEQVSFLEPDWVIYLRNEAELFLPLSAHSPSNNMEVEEDGYDIPYSLNESQYEQLTRARRRHMMANDIFLRVSQYVNVELNIEHIKSLFISSIQLAEDMYPQENPYAFETFAVYRFILSPDFFKTAVFTQLMETLDLRTSVHTYYQSTFTEQDPMTPQQIQWLSHLSSLNTDAYT